MLRDRNTVVGARKRATTSTSWPFIQTDIDMPKLALPIDTSLEASSDVHTKSSGYSSSQKQAHASLAHDVGEEAGRQTT